MTRKFSICASSKPRSTQDQQLTLELNLPTVFHLLHSLLGTLEKNRGVIGNCPPGEPAIAVVWYGVLKENKDVPVDMLTVPGQ